MSDQQIPALQAPVAPVSEQPQSNTVDPKLDLYARKERELAKKRKEFEDMRKAWEQEKKQYLPKSLFKDDPARALSEVQLDYDKLTETILNQPNINDPTIRNLQSKITQMEEAEMRRQQQMEEQEQARAEQMRMQRLNEVKLTTTGNPDFEIVEKWGAHDAVMSYLDEAAERGETVSVKDACKAVEDMLIAEVSKILDSQKIKSKLNPTQEPAAQTPETPAAAPQAQNKWKNPSGYSVENSPRNQFNTLTNRLTQESTKPSSSEKERVMRAIAAMEGRLNK